MITTRTYRINYQSINDLSHIVKNLPLHRFNNSSYFNNIKDLFWRMSNFEEKYKILMQQIQESRIKADDLAELLDKGSFDKLEAHLAKGNHGFSVITYSSDKTKIYFGTKRIVTPLQDYITRYSELLETFKYLLADIYNDPLAPRDSFNGYIAIATTQSKNDFNFTALTEFNRDLWNKQKHHGDIKLSAFIYNEGNMAMPKIKLQNGSGVEVETFIENSLENMNLLAEFIRNKSLEGH